MSSKKPKTRKKVKMPKNFANVRGWRPTPYHLSMKWDIFDVNRTITTYELLNGEELDSTKPLPLEILQMIYKGDLLIAIHRNIIWEEQAFKIRIHSIKTRKIDDHSVVADIPDYVVDFSDKPIRYPVLMRGREDGLYTFKRDGVFAVPWEGLTEEWKKYLNNHFGDDYEVFEAQAEMSCTAAFTSPFAEKEFKELKRINQARKFA